MTTFQVQTSMSPAGVPAVKASGDLDVASADQLVAAAHSILEDRTTLLVDLGDVTFMDSTGLGALIKIRNHLLERDGELVLSATSSAVERVLVLVGMAEGFGVASS